MGTHPIFESDFDCLTDWLGQIWKSHKWRRLSKSRRLLFTTTKKAQPIKRSTCARSVSASKFPGKPEREPTSIKNAPSPVMSSSDVITFTSSRSTVDSKRDTLTWRCTFPRASVTLSWVIWCPLASAAISQKLSDSTLSNTPSRQEPRSNSQNSKSDDGINL